MGAFGLPLVDGTLNAASLTVMPPEAVGLPAASVHPEAVLRLLHVTAPAGTPGGAPGPFAPADAFTVPLSIENYVEWPDGVPRPSTLYELRPNPFPADVADLLRAWPGGVPTFYLAFIVRPPAFTAGQLLRRRDPLALAGGSGDLHAWLGVMFEDRVELDPWAAALLIDAAMAAAGTAAADPDRVNWRTLGERLRPTRKLVALDHRGRRADSAVDIRVAGTTEWQRVTPVRGELNLTPGGTPLEVRATAGRTVASVYMASSGSGVAVRGASRAVTAPDAPAPAPVTLPGDFHAGYLQLLDLDAWLAPRPPGHTLPRYHSGSRLEPLVDGEPTFAALVADLARARGRGFGLHATGLFMRDFPLAGSADTALPAIVAAIRASGGDVRLLGHRLLAFEPEQWRRLHGTLRTTAMAGAWIGAAGHLLLLDPRVLATQTTPAVLATLAVLGLVASAAGFVAAVAISEADFRAIMEGEFERSRPLVDRLNGVAPGIAALSMYPATLADNPLARDGRLPLDLHNFVTRIGIWHQKVQLVRRTRSDTDLTPMHVAYVGGIDLEPNRLDSPAHQGKPFARPGEHLDWSLHPFHDVHARVTGPAAADLFQTVAERFQHHRGQPASERVGALGPDVFAAPAPATLAAEVGGAGRHVVQIGRTYYRPAPGGTPLPFAPRGETDIVDTLLRAIASARDYIYIEDQYFTPNGDRGDTSTIVGALLAAASSARRLVVVVPAENDQPFGWLRRERLYGALREAWGTRVVIGSPLRRPLLPPTGNQALEGRWRLVRDLDSMDTEVVLGPLSRLGRLAVPSWLWVEGELMLCTALEQREEQNELRVRVVRASEENARSWRVHHRSHKAGAPATWSQLKGIYVHSKLMIVDDVFVSIGSANLNRRGFFHDAEINAFAIPEELRAARENPARALRVALWAEQLGLPPRIGAVAVADPIDGFDLFARHWLGGNRLAPVEAFALPRLSGSTSGSAPGASGLEIAFSSAGTLVSLGLALTAGALHVDAWNKVVDPTTDSDAERRPGP